MQIKKLKQNTKKSLQKIRSIFCKLKPITYYLSPNYGFTLVETLVAVSVLVVAVAAPMTLAAKSLLTAFYAKDQITASYLAQEAIELVRNQRDQNFIRILQGDSTAAWLDGITTTGSSFTIDARNGAMDSCGGVCDNLYLNKVDGIYAYSTGSGWQKSRFVRTTTVDMVSGSNDNEAVIAVVVQWNGSFGSRTFTLSEHIYNWVPGS